MIAFEAIVSGEQIGSQLVDEPEDCAEMLAALAEQIGKDEREELCDHLSQMVKENRDNIRDLAKAIVEACA